MKLFLARARNSLIVLCHLSLSLAYSLCLIFQVEAFLLPMLHYKNIPMQRLGNWNRWYVVNSLNLVLARIDLSMTICFLSFIVQDVLSQNWPPKFTFATWATWTSAPIPTFELIMTLSYHLPPSLVILHIPLHHLPYQLLLEITMLCHRLFMSIIARSKYQSIVSSLSHQISISWYPSFTIWVITLCWRLIFLEESSRFMLFSHVTFFNGWTILFLFSRSVRYWMCPMTHPIQSSRQMRQHYRLYHTAGDQGNPAMVIQFPFLGVNYQTWSFNRGDLRGITSSTRMMDLIVVPSHASNSWTCMMIFLSQTLRHSKTETTQNHHASMEEFAPVSWHRPNVAL